MFGSYDRVGNDFFHLPIPQSTQIEHAGQYEGKDNAPGGYYRRAARNQNPEKKKEKPKSDHKIDIVA
jgi:hypothetical protein